MDSTGAIIQRLATPHAGAFDVRRAGMAGLDRHAISRLERAHMVRRVHRSVYFAGHVLTIEGRRWAAIMAAGDDALIAGEAALHDWGVDDRGATAVEIVVTIRQRPLAGVRTMHTATLHREDRSQVRGRPTTTIERALVDVAGRRSVHQLCRLLREATFREQLDVARLRRTIARNRNRHGIGRVREALRLHLHGRGGTDSGTEDRFARMLGHVGVFGVAHNLTLVAHGTELRVDVFVEHLGLVIEIDPSNHDSPPVRREDALRGALCRSAGLSHLSVPGHQLRHGVMQVVALQRRWIELGCPPPAPLPVGVEFRTRRR